MYEQLLPKLRKAYDRAVDEREGKKRPQWKDEIRASFLEMLKDEGKRSLLEIGAGTGVDSMFFQDNDIKVICTDLSPENIRSCVEKGLEAYEMDFLNLEFPSQSFDSAYAMNCLLHVPSQDFSNVLKIIRDLLKPSGLFYLGQYGGQDSEGTWPKDHYKPKRFFSFLSDDRIRQVAVEFFTIIEFTKNFLANEEDLHFQSLFLRRY
jgi:SAM-dependent methyltransferase